jgi:type I restriction-modification system DNA methylase subunit
MTSCAISTFAASIAIILPMTAGLDNHAMGTIFEENDWLEAIIALPLNTFYNTGIATYIWVLTNRKPEGLLAEIIGSGAV